MYDEAQQREIMLDGIDRTVRAPVPSRCGSPRNAHCWVLEELLLSATLS